VLQGAVLDVVIDMRPHSPSFGQQYAVELTEQNHLQLCVPRRFAHGFLVLSDKAVFFYKCDNYYNKAAEGGIVYNDPTLNIPWPIAEVQFIVSEKDKTLPFWNTACQDAGFEAL
jgi:dTDP-4-dehydrorhamnose 3,5-epimerase